MVICWFVCCLLLPEGLTMNTNLQYMTLNRKTQLSTKRLIARVLFYTDGEEL